MSAEAFFDSIRRAYRTAVPKVEVDSDQIKAEAIERVLRGCDFWLTPKVVEDYDPSDFAHLPLSVQNELAGAVQSFKADAAKVRADQPASQEDRDAAWDSFSRILATVRKLVIEEWISTVDVIFKLVEQESRTQTPPWATKRLEKSMTDSFLGHYMMEQLLVHRPDARFLLDPVSRYAPGTTGVLDLYMYPSLGGTMLSQVNGSWRIHPVKNGQNPVPWTPANFRAALDGLARTAA